MTKWPSACRVLALLLRSGFLKACVGSVYPLSPSTHPSLPADGLALHNCLCSTNITLPFIIYFAELMLKDSQKHYHECLNYAKQCFSESGLSRHLGP